MSAVEIQSVIRLGGMIMYNELKRMGEEVIVSNFDVALSWHLPEGLRKVMGNLSRIAGTLVEF